jgi:hypothetical protein
MTHGAPARDKEPKSGEELFTNGLCRGLSRKSAGLAPQ